MRNRLWACEETDQKREEDALPVVPPVMAAILPARRCTPFMISPVFVVDGVLLCLQKLELRKLERGNYGGVKSV